MSDEFRRKRTWIRTRINGVRVLAASPCLPRLKPGTVLLREYQGDRLTVTVVPTDICGAKQRVSFLNAVLCAFLVAAIGDP
jgi:hypothetical protein